MEQIMGAVKSAFYVFLFLFVVGAMLSDTENRLKLGFWETV